jgi:hypothetical protein
MLEYLVNENKYNTLTAFKISTEYTNVRSNFKANPEVFPMYLNKSMDFF